MRRSIVLLLCLVGACETPAILPMTDGGVTERAVMLPAPPTAPAMPQWTACPDGWRPDQLEGASFCQPWAEDRAPTCAAGEIALPGAPCEAIDTCPADGWPADLPATGVVYVRAGATGGDGSRAMPFATIQQGLTAAAAGNTVAVAVGEYDGPVRVRGVTLRGACAAGTVVRNPLDGLDDTAVELGSGTVRGLHLIGGNFALEVTASSTATGQDLWLQSPYGALRLEGRSHFEGDRMRIDGVAIPTSSVNDLCGLGVRLGASAVLRHTMGTSTAPAFANALVFDDDTAFPPISVTMEDSSVCDVAQVFAGSWNAITLRRSAFERTSFVAAVEPGSTIDAEDVVFRDLRLEGGNAIGLAAVGGTVTVSRLFAQRVVSGLLNVEQRAGTTSTGTLTASDLVIEGANGTVLLFADLGGTMTLSRVLATGIAANALGADNGATIMASDLTIRTEAGTVEETGDIVDASHGAHVTITKLDAHITRALALAIAGASIEITDVRADGGNGPFSECVDGDARACDPDHPSSVILRRAFLHDLTRVAFALYRAHGELYDVDIDGVAELSLEAEALSIHGTLTAERVRVRHAASRGVLLNGEGTQASITDLSIDTVTGAGCEGATCMNGDGLTCATGASGLVTHIDIQHAQRAGLALLDDCAHLQVIDATITQNEIGVLTDTHGAMGATLEQARVMGNVTDFNTLEISVPTEVRPL